jgi:phenylalanyl-tRNA synthetase beta chain
MLDGLMRNLGIKYSLEPANHKSFIAGRCASVNYAGKRIGFIGELSPIVLEKFEIEKPVITFEIDIQEIFEKLS